MKIEEVIGLQISRLRKSAAMSQAQLAESLAPRLEKPWSRQAVNMAERGKRSLSAAELAALALALGTDLVTLFTPWPGDTETVELQSGSIPVGEYQTLIRREEQPAGKELLQAIALVNESLAASGTALEHLQRTVHLDAGEG
ncbi:helix-turn-helix domain-containing protein [Streptomyces sp. NPDC002685]|uniref:helix-turn-helix domain-containing protein n=1 Tax=Streptomyces sp. NPDC002685 TaxID=3154540 RepID=UPI0033343018